MRKKCFSKKKKKSPPPKKKYFNLFFYTNFFLDVGNSIKPEENMKYWQIFVLNFIFIQYLKNS